MSYYKICPHCGAHLDPGEVCDCRETKKTALDATNIQDGGAEQSLTAVSASTITENGGFVK